MSWKNATVSSGLGEYNATLTNWAISVFIGYLFSYFITIQSLLRYIP
jgi:hypothetical protein